MVKNGRAHATGNLHGGGCSCCNSRQERRSAIHTAKRAEERAWREDQRAQS